MQGQPYVLMVAPAQCDKINQAKSLVQHNDISGIFDIHVPIFLPEEMLKLE